MPPIDDKIVAMSFENSKFESGVSQTISSLDKLKAALHLPGAAKGLQELDAASKKVDLHHISDGVQQVENKLQALRLVAIGVFSQLATQAIRAGGSFVKAFTIGPAKAGFKEYTTNLNAVQTILANTQASGAGLKEVNAALDELNTYSDKTIYNFSQMARNIGTFTAAGVDLKTATASIKGIANLAALSGSNADQASTAMYQLSQAIASGSVKLMDWNSVVNAGMGGTVFQRSLAMTAEKMGTLKKGTVELVGPMKNVKIAGESFRNSLSAPGKDGWLTSKVLTETLQMLTSDLTDAELRAKGWNEEQIKAIQTQAKTAMLAATTVKTLTGVIDVARETAGSGWAKTWQIIFGDFEEAKMLFTRVSNAVNGVLIDSARARNNMLSDWKEMGGRTALIDAISSAFKSFGQILVPIKDAFRQFFPKTTGEDLMYLTQLFERFVEKLKPSTKTIFQLRHTFAGLFAVLDIGWEIIKGVVGVFMDLVGATGAGGGGFLSFTNNIGNSLVAFHEWLIEGGRLAAFFDRLGAILAAPMDLLRAIANAVSDLFAGFSPGDFFGQVDGIGKKLSPLEAIFDGLAKVWEKFLEVVSGSGKVMRAGLDAIVEAISGSSSAISGAASGMNFDAILQVIKTGLFAGLVVMFKQFLGRGSLMSQLTGRRGLFGNLKGTMGALTGSLKSMQTNLKADTLMKIAIAIGVLAVSVVALSLVNPDKLKSAMVALTVMMVELLGAMAILDKISSTSGFLKMPLITASLIALAVAIDLLTISVLALSLLSWQDLLKGLTGVGVLLGGIVIAVKPLSASSPGMIKAGIGIAAMAAGLLLLAAAVRVMGTMKPAELARGLGGIAAGLILMTFAMQKMPAVPLKSTVGLIAMAGALLILATAVRTMGSMDLHALGKGLGGMAAGLILMVFAMDNMPAKSMLRNSIALIAMAGAVRLLAESVMMMGGMSIRELAKGLIGLGGGLAIMAGALYLMGGAVPGAIALGIASAGIAVLAPALVALGKQSWGQILKGMVALAVALGVLAAAAVLITPAIPSMIGLGVALTLIGAGLALAGIGIAAVAWAIAALIVALPAGVGILIAALVELTQGIIDNAKLLILGLLEIVRAFAATAPKFVDALVKILDSLVDGLIKIVPKLMQAADIMLTAMLTFLDNNRERLIQAGFDLLLGLVYGIQNNIGPFTTAVVGIITAFLVSLKNNLTKIIKAGADLIIAFIKGIASNYSRIVTTVIDIIQKFITTIVSKLGGLPAAGLKILTKLLTGIKNNLKDVVTVVGDIIVTFITEVGRQANRIIEAGSKVIIRFIQGLGENAVEIANAAGEAIVKFLQGLTLAVETYGPQISEETKKLGHALIKGIFGGLTDRAEGLYSKAREIVNKLIGIWKKIPIIGSPSRVTTKIGQFLVDGLTKGLDDTAPNLYASATAVSMGVIDQFKNALGIHSPSKVMQEIGKAVGGGFAEGLKGSAEDIRNAFTSLNEILLSATADARATLTEEREKLAAMLKDKDEKLDEINKKKFKKEAERAKAIAKVHEDYKKPIEEAQKAIKLNEMILKRTTAATTILNKNLKAQKKELIGLAKDFDRVTEELEKAKNALVEVTQARDDIQKQYSAKPEISDKMTEEIKSGREAIKAEQDKLTEVLADKVETDNKMAENVAAANAKVVAAQAKFDAALTPKAKDAAQKVLDAENLKLKKLVETKDSSAEKIAEANAGIVEAQAKFDELVEGKVLNAEGTEVDQLATYMLALKNQISAVSAYAATLEQLRKLGIDEETYKKLVDEGTADQSFADALLAGGKTAVTGLNKLDTQLAAESLKLANRATDYLFPAGVAAAQGIVKGLEDQLSAIRKQMNKIGDMMYRTLMKKLRGKSPSQAFADIGEFAMMGLAQGITGSKKVVTKAIEDSAQDALNAMRKNMRYVSEAVTNELNPNPVITPILDLTQVRSQSQELASLTAGASLGQAAAISAAQLAAQAEDLALIPSGPSVTFEQNNYSPKALTDIEIYRNTRNQLSQLKSVLAT